MAFNALRFLRSSSRYCGEKVVYSPSSRLQLAMYFRRPGRRPSPQHLARLVGWLWLTAAFVFSATVTHGQSLPPYVLSSPVTPLLVQIPENSWVRVNTNLFSDVWTPTALEPLDRGSVKSPSRIILAWSGFA